MKTEHIVFGVHAIESLLKREPERLLEAFFLESHHNDRLMSLSQQFQKQGIACHTKTSKQLQDWLGEVVHQGVVARVREKSLLHERDLTELLNTSHQKDFLILILDGVQDPHNLGACLRTADAAGVTAVVIPKDKATGLTPIVHKVASGAVETVSIVQVSNLARMISDLKELGIWVKGADVAAKQSLYTIDFKIPSAIVLGAEGSGLRRLTKDLCDETFHIPMFGYLESLNVSVATGICLFEARRQRL